MMPCCVSLSGAADRIAPLSVGAMAPDFTLEAHDGRTIILSQARGQASVVLVFYRGSW
jgi:peroxiredoxin